MELRIRAQRFLHGFDTVSISQECNCARESKEDQASFGLELRSVGKPCHRRRHSRGYLGAQRATSASVCACGRPVRPVRPVRDLSARRHAQLLSASVNPRVESGTRVTRERHVRPDMAFISLLFHYGHGNILLFEIMVRGESYYPEFHFRLVQGLWVQQDGKRLPGRHTEFRGTSWW